MSSSSETPESTVKGIGRYILQKSYKYQIAYVRAREHFPHILNARGLLGEGAEIGTQHGYFSEVILSSWKGKKLYSIDPWKEFPSEGYVDVANTPQSEHDEIYRRTLNRLKKFGRRSSILRETSNQALEHFQDGQLDFVYIDAQHHYEAVKEDVRSWYPKVRKGGILAGHDYLDGHIEQGVFGVKSAVDEFARENGLRVIVSKEDDWKSWFMLL